jgi:D-alanine-D-alanine ligase
MPTDNQKLKVAVLMGGVGAERDISLQSGANMAAAIREAGFETVEYDITRDDMRILGDGTIDVFFLALHGEFGEDGQLQEILEKKNLCYTGCDSRASRLAFDKIASKEIFKQAGVTVPRHICLSAQTSAKGLVGRLGKIGEKFVVKPIRQGSSVGVVIVAGCEEAAAAAVKIFGEFGDCMIEQFIEGREVTVGILSGQALPIIEIRSKQEFYDYHAKYLDDATEFLFDTVTDEKTVIEINRSAITCFDSLGCRHFGRVDMILSDSGEPYVLEINTLPGLTTHSLLPKAAARAGMSNSQLCTKIIEASLETFKR